MRPRVWIAGVSLLGLGACSIGAGSFAGKTCDSQADCPSPYVCVQVRPGGPSCELLHGLDDRLGDGGTGGGGGTFTLDYCHDAKPVLLRTCISNCHGADHTGAPGEEFFRLDSYRIDGGLGAYDLRVSIAAQVSAGAMPLPTSMPQPTATERMTLVGWANSSAPDCVGEDGGTDAGDGG